MSEDSDIGAEESKTGVCLRVYIYDEYLPSSHSKSGGDVQRGSRLSNAAFIVHDRNGVESHFS